ncbi:MAG TPA: DUF2924 domain-containing protein [Phycisphaerae bacterium]|nr:DUF2924 domain-containing protein [Phycisphaerae bacterium]HOI53859.1 DUF2924 domain-containing protein [Phycisphaerae bacterium]
MSDTVLTQLAELPTLSVGELRGRWRSLYGTEPPASCKSQYLIRRLAWRIQELAYGGLSESAQATLKQVADEDAATARTPSSRKREMNLPVAGTRLVRTWNGQRHEVLVARDGFDFRGCRYRSLSAVAKAITGSHRSGPAFFGLKASGRETE